MTTNAPDAMTTCNSCEIEPMQPDSPAGQCAACEADARQPAAKCGGTDAHRAHRYAKTWCAGNVDIIAAAR